VARRAMAGGGWGRGELLRVSSRVTIIIATLLYERLRYPEKRLHAPPPTPARLAARENSW